MSTCNVSGCLYGYHLPQTSAVKSLAWATWKAAGRPISPEEYERCPMNPPFVIHEQFCSARDPGPCICGAAQ